MYENMPYSNFHDLNTDWIVKKIKDVETSEANAKASEEAAEESATATALSAEQAHASELNAEASALASANSATASANSATEANDYVNATREQVNLLQSRVDNIIPSGTQTQGNTELLDIRTEYTGNIADSAGNAVRNETKDIADTATITYRNLTNGKLLLPCNFIHGSFSGAGALSFLKYRIRASEPFGLEKETTYRISNGFRMRYLCYDRTTGDYVTTTAWTTGNNVTISTQYLILPMIGRSTEDTTEIADIKTFANAVYTNFTDETMTMQGMPADSAKVGEITDKLGAIPENFSNLLANIDFNCRANVLSSNGWTDLPDGHTSGMFTNQHFTSAFDVQTYVSNAYGTMFNRIVRRSNRALYRDWKETYTPAPNMEDFIKNLNVMTLGDSIARGGRNSGRGFVGDIGCTYVNIAVGGATLSNKVDSSSSTDSVHPMGASNIPDMLVKYSLQTAQDWYIIPDAIVANGGINDFLKNAPLGTIPDHPVNTDADANMLDMSTMTGGLQYLFYQMIKLYPKAHRFFVLSHRTDAYPWTPHFNGGYNQTELNITISAICKLYGVTVIDIFNESEIDSYFDQYVSPTAYRDDPTVTNLYYVDHDKIHPLALGYRNAYAPRVKAELIKAINL